MRRRAGLTLVEVLIGLALIVLAYALVGFATVQLARAVRTGSEAAQAKSELMAATEQLRWQLRGLYAPQQQACLEGGRTDTEGRDYLVFLTTSPQRGEGAAEVGYQIDSLVNDEGEERVGLLYREFPYRDPEGLRPTTDQDEARWRMLSDRVDEMQVEYSPDGAVWQREWDGSDAPRAVRVRLLTKNGDELSFAVYPGVSSQRW